MTSVRHLVSVWNPAYASDAMSASVALLLHHVRSHRDGKREEEDVFVWWGKAKSPNRQAPLPHLDDILAMDEALRQESDGDQEVHLYLTDYRSLYVGHVGEIIANDLRADKKEEAYVPAFYRTSDLRCDCWFKLFDIRRVIADDTIAVIDELKKLRNTRYNDRPVSIYGGMVELPLIVTREDGARYFEPDVREKLIEGRYWVEFDAERAGIGELEGELRDNVVGQRTWHALDPAVRTFVATAESLFRAHRRDPAFDFSPVVVDFAKAIELQTNIILRRGLSGVPASDRLTNVDGRSVDPTAGEHWPLGALARLIGEAQHLNQALKRRLGASGEWFTASLPAVLRELSDVRNPAAHSKAVAVADAQRWRDRVLGIGNTGLLSELARSGR
jgi:hypothetical protein